MVTSYLGLGLILLLLLIFGILQWLQLPVGNFVDWVVGATSFGWLLVVTTVPWNIYFDAKEVIQEAAISAEKGITVDQKQVTYVQMVARRSLWFSLALHLISAVSLWVLALVGISQIGYLGSTAALLLTGLRPAVRTYKYFAARISLLRQQFHYPREDVVELRSRVGQIEADVKHLKTLLDADDPSSWVAGEQRQREAIRQDLTTVAAELASLQSTNRAEHDRLSREAKQAIAQLSEDGQFLEHVREIIRFFKTA